MANNIKLYIWLNIAKKISNLRLKLLENIYIKWSSFILHNKFSFKSLFLAFLGFFYIIHYIIAIGQNLFLIIPNKKDKNITFIRFKSEFNFAKDSFDQDNYFHFFVGIIFKPILDDNISFFNFFNIIITELIDHGSYVI